MKKKLSPNQKRLLKALKAYMQETDLDLPDAISAALADMRHICDQEGLDFGRLDGQGYSFYCEENGQRQAA